MHNRSANEVFAHVRVGSLIQSKSVLGTYFAVFIRMTLDSHEKQKINEGYGPVYHRIYSILLSLPIEQVREAMRDLQADVNQFSPQLLARFEKLRGEAKTLKVEDEFQIHITGPWNGPVRVIHCSPDAFCFCTLQGHMEAGEIHFRLKAQGAHHTLFEIESLARSRDAIVDLVYDKVPIAKMAQTQMWSHFCQSFAEYALKQAGKETEKPSEVEILTERRDEENGQWVRT